MWLLRDRVGALVDAFESPNGGRVGPPNASDISKSEIGSGELRDSVTMQIEMQGVLEGGGSRGWRWLRRLFSYKL